MRILGPNVSSTFNLHARFNSKRSHSKRLVATPLAGISQGGYAFSDLLAVGDARGMGVGKFVHTGNECDLQAADFLEHFGKELTGHGHSDVPGDTSRWEAFSGGGSEGNKGEACRCL